MKRNNQRESKMKRINAGTSLSLVIAASMISQAFATDVSTVSGLIDAVANATADDEIVLAKGTYDLSEAPCMSRVGHLYTTKKVSFRGATGNPDDVVLLGSTNRILYLTSTGALSIRDMTFKNGTCTNNTATTNKPEEGRDGGAICFRGQNAAAIVSNCVFVGNSAAATGGAIGTYYSINLSTHAGHFFNCVFSNNVSLSHGGAMRCPMELVGCRFYDNTAEGNYAGAVYQPRFVATCHFEGNQSNRGGGALAWETLNDGTYDDFIISNSTFKLNHTVRGGGAIYGRSGEVVITNCTFEGNRCTYNSSNDGYGGGAVYNITNALIGCTFITNSAPYGGSIRKCNDAYSTYLVSPDDNAQAGQVAYESQLVGATVVANGSSKTLFTSSQLEGCRISGSCKTSVALFGGTALNRCRIENVGRMDGEESSNGPYLLYGNSSVTNCLFANCDIYSYCHNASGEWINSTFTGNKFTSWSAGSSQKRVIPVVNCLFYGNSFVGHSYDIGSSTANCIIGFTNCVYASTSGTEQYAPGENCYNYYGTDFDPKFVGAAADPENPYALKRTSPLMTTYHGLVMDWMTDGTDIRGDGYSRLRNGVVDIGCYQCLLPPTGFRIIFR